MNTKDFIRLGIPLGEATRRVTGFVTSFILAAGDKIRLEEEMKQSLLIFPPRLAAQSHNSVHSVSSCSILS